VQHVNSDGTGNGVAALDVASVSHAYGAKLALDDVSFSIPPSTFAVLLGLNGAGKTTLFSLITGAVPPNAGSIHLAGEDITRLPAQRRCLAGICRSHQVPHPFEKLTVAENLLVAACFGQGKREAEVVDEVGAILEQTGLAAKANRVSGALPLLDRKRLEMARALATNPRLLLLDEIAGGLTQGECDELVATIRGIHASGRTIVWIEHIVHALVAVVSRLLVLNFGKLIAEGEPQAVLASPQVREIYLGSPV